MKKFLIIYSFSLGLMSPGYAENETNNHVKNIIQNTHLNANVVKLAMQAYRYASVQTQVKKPLLTIVDYSQPSIAKRLYVVDLKSDKLLMNIWVAHGKNTGELTSTRFSNQPQSLQSSIGVFVTEHTYIGHHGTSMVLNGLEKNINNNAKNRHIVVHGAPYVSEAFYKKTGRMGRSFGCLAVNPQDVKQLTDLTANGSVIFAYAPQGNYKQILSNL